MDLVKSMMIAASGMRAQSGRMRVLAENIATRNPQRRRQERNRTAGR